MSVQPKVLQLLLYLVEHRHRIVTTDEFFQVLWPDQVVGETSLTKAVRSARLALGDSGSSQAALKTVRGRGYRFIAPVRERITTHPLGLEIAPRTTASENDNAGALAVTRAISAPARAALHVAAAIGYEFSATLLAAALVSRTAAPNVEPLAAALEEARLAGLIRPVSGVSGSYVFARATIREALCRELSNEKLRELRARIALVLETMEYENELRARTGNSSASW